jgi:hypothetical protein
MVASFFSQLLAITHQSLNGPDGDNLLALQAADLACGGFCCSGQFLFLHGSLDLGL